MNLSQIIELYFLKAKTHGEASYILRGGLTLHFKVENEVILTMTLSRPDVCPSLNEWETVLKYFMWAVTTKPRTIGNSLTASFPIHPKFL